MLQSNGAGGEENPDFKWGAKKAVGKTDPRVQFYESFTYEGIEYKLLDCAYFFVHGQCETSIGKLVKMYETSTGEKKVRVVWFFRPTDVRNFLGTYEPTWDELFLACGDDKGVSNVNNVEAIIGKCNVLCVSNDNRNPRLDRTELRRADYVFSHTFHTRRKVILEELGDAIAGFSVGSFFNKTRDKQPRLNSTAAPSSRASPVKSFPSEPGSTKFVKKDRRDGMLTSKITAVRKGFSLEDRADHVPMKKNPPVKTDTTSRSLKTKTRASGSSVHPEPSKKRKLILNTPESDDSDPQPGEKRLCKNPPLVEKAPSQNNVNNSWYKKLAFEDELKAAIKDGRLLLIENIEPSYTSLEVEDLCYKAFKERVDAKMIQASLQSSPHYGRALVIFATKKGADSAMLRLTEGCLMLQRQRPLVGQQISEEIGKCRSFTGHFSRLDTYLKQTQNTNLKQTQKRKAVSTSHCAQPNHIVHEMSLEWFALRGKSELKWKRLFEVHAKEINSLRNKHNKDKRRTQGEEQMQIPSLKQQSG